MPVTHRHEIKNHQHWSLVIFVNESSYSLYQSDGRVRTCRHFGEKLEGCCIQKTGGIYRPSIMTWGAFHVAGTLEQLRWRHNERDGVSIICWTVCSGADQRKHQSSVSLAFVRGIQLCPGDSPHKGPVTQNFFPFDDVFMCCRWMARLTSNVALTPFTKIAFTGLGQFSNQMCICELQCHSAYCVEQMQLSGRGGV